MSTVSPGLMPLEGGSVIRLRESVCVSMIL
jgi:hypothetical protein